MICFLSKCKFANSQYILLKMNIYCMRGWIYTSSAVEYILHQQLKYIFISEYSATAFSTLAGLADCGHAYWAIIVHRHT